VAVQDRGQGRFEATSARRANRKVAETALFLASDGAGYVTPRKVVHLDGGWLPAG